MVKKGTLIILCIIGIVSVVCPQKKKDDLNFKVISIEQGLSQSSVNTILQDHKGFMWFGTQEGLNCYDGRNFTIYKHDRTDPGSISHSNIRVIYEDRNRDLWIATYGGGLNKFDRKNEVFKHYRHVESSANSLSHNDVFAVFEDSYGQLWLGTWGGGLNRFSKKKNKFVRYVNDPAKPKSLSHNIVRVIYEDSKKDLWIGTYGGGVCKYDREGDRFYPTLELDRVSGSPFARRIMTILELNPDEMLFGTDGAGLFIYNVKTNSRQWYKHNQENPRSLGHNRVRSIFRDSKGQIWIATYGGGISILNRDNNRGIFFTNLQHKASVSGSLSNNRVLSIAESKDDLLWFGTSGGGVNLFDRQKKAFRNYRHDPNDPMSLAENSVRSFFQGRDGILWVGTNSNGLNRIDRKKGAFSLFKHDPKRKHTLANNQIFALSEDANGILWIGTWGGGLNRFDRKKNTFTSFKNNPNDPQSISNDKVRVICVDKSGFLWIGTWGGGLNRMNSQSGQFTRFQNNAGASASLSDDRIFAVVEDHQGNLWVGTWNGLNKYLGNNRFDRYRNDPANQNSISSNRIFSIQEDHHGSLWIGTAGGGLNRFDPQSNSWTRYDSRNGLYNEVIYGILPERNRAGETKYLWLSSNKGLIRFDPQNETFKHFDGRDGLSSSEFNADAYYMNSDGEMFFGGDKGFTVFDPRQIKDNLHIPPVEITAFKIFNEVVSLENYYNDNNEIEISYRDKYFSFEFVALNYRVPEKNQYMYKLDGFDDEWIKCGARNFASYTNLDGGTYTFLVRGSNNDGKWNQTGVSVVINIIPPLWKKGWFQILFFLGVILAIAVFFRQRNRAIRLRNRGLEDLNEALKKQIVERKQTEKALKKSEEKFRRIFENSLDVLYQTDNDGTITMISPSGIKLLGYDNEGEILGKNSADFYFDPKDRVFFLSKLNKRIELLHFREKLKGRNGEVINVETSSRIVFDEDGNPSGVEGIFRNISEHLRIEGEKDRLQKDIMKAKKMEAVGNLAGGMAHEFNNMMTIIIGNAEMLKRDMGQKDVVIKRLEPIVNAATKSAWLTNQLLSFSRKQLLQIKKININDLIENAKGGIKDKVGERTVVDFRLDQAIGLVNADPELMDQVIYALVENAREAIGDAGVLIIETRQVVISVNEQKKTGEPRDGTFICLSVKDDGKGMDEDTLQHIFEPFYTTKEVGKGTGLSLSFAYGTIYQHDGWIDVSSNPGQGTCFEIYLPLASK